MVNSDINDLDFFCCRARHTSAIRRPTHAVGKVGEDGTPGLGQSGRTAGEQTGNRS